MANDSPAARGVEVVSAVPGRIRLRAVDAPGHRALAAVAEHLESLPEVASVQVRERSGSVVARFDPRDAAAVSDGLRAFGVDAPGGAVRPAAANPGAVVGDAVATVNGAVGRRLDGTDLRVLVPLGLGLLAARRALRGDDRLADAPWYVLAWYASETFQKFHDGRPAGGRLDTEGR